MFSSGSHTLKVFTPSHSECLFATEQESYNYHFKRHVIAMRHAEFTESPETAQAIVIFQQFAHWHLRDLEFVLSGQFIRKYADKIFVVSWDDTTAGLFPGCYTSLTPRMFDPLWHRVCCYPGDLHWDRPFEKLRLELATEPTRLFSFRGNTTSHLVRAKLQRCLAQHRHCAFTELNQKFHHHTPDEVAEYVRDILESRFVLCPRGISPSTYRLYEVMQLGRCPVIISDEWIAPPGPDWEKCTIRIPECEVDRIPKLLEEHSYDHARALGAAARSAWESHFSEPSRFVGLFDAIRELYETRITIPPSNVQNLRKRLRSFRFRWNAGWTMPQRCRRVWRRLTGRFLARS